MDKKQIVYMNVDSLIPYVNNPRINDNAVDAVASSIKNFGFKSPIIVDKTNEIINGHTRLKAAKKLGYTEVPVIVADDLTEQQVRAFRLADNKVAEIAEWDFEMLESELAFIDIDMSEFGFDISDESEVKTKDDYVDYVSGALASDFLVMPSSVLDTRRGEWQERKRMWKDLGIASEVGRGENLTFSKSLSNDTLKGTSIFDPVLCELCYLWFTPSGGAIADPFSGGSVRGVVAEWLGFSYTGIDLRNEQIEANINNATEIGCDLSKINWICDDSQNVDNYIEDGSVDLIFTCPPYFDLEVYSDNEADISNMSYEDFSVVYRNILMKFADKLKDNRFAIVVISDVRDKKGGYRDLTGLTKQAFVDKGFIFYNDIILVNTLGSGGLRVRRQMEFRKVIRTHQNVLVFFKGDQKQIPNDFETIKGLGQFEEDTE